MFEQELTKPAKSIRAAVSQRKTSGLLATFRRVRVLRLDTSLTYLDNPQFINKFEPQRVEEDIWDPGDQNDFQNSVLKGLKEYESLVSALGPKADSLTNFTRAVCYRSFRGLDDNKFTELVNDLGRELEGQPLPVKVTAYINGLSIAESPLVISDSLVLRRPTFEDISEEITLDEYGGFPVLHSSHTLFCVIGDFVFDATSTGLAQRSLLSTLNALCLFRVGGVTADRYTMVSRATNLPGGMIFGGAIRNSPLSYTLTGADAVTLKKFLDEIVPLLPDPFTIDRGVTEKEIAYTRYRDALFQVGPTERAITLAVTALEALLSENRPELAHRLAQRVSLFLRILRTQSDPQVTYDNVKTGYKIRSKFIHGDSLEPKDRPKADSLMPILMAYARECLLAFFQMQIPKKQLLSQLDRAMIDPRGQSELEASFARVTHR